MPGTRVVVPFGRSNRKRSGLVLKIEAAEGDDINLKSILSAPEGEPALNSEMLELVEWLKENTFCTYYDAVKTMLPSGMNINIRERYSLNGKRRG